EDLSHVNNEGDEQQSVDQPACFDASERTSQRDDVEVKERTEQERPRTIEREKMRVSVPRPSMLGVAEQEHPGDGSHQSSEDSIREAVVAAHREHGCQSGALEHAQENHGVRQLAHLGPMIC